MKGLVLKGSNNIFYVECEDGKFRNCSIKGKVLKDSALYYNPLAAGDLVNIEPDTHSEDEGLVTGLITRKNSFLRLNQKLNMPQLLAANIDLLVCVASAANPPFRPRFVDRVLVQAEIQKIPVLIVINKCDLKLSADVRERVEDWKRLGYKTIEVSAKEGRGMDNLIEKLSAKTSALVGQSGVGKSTLLNFIAPGLNLKTSAISDKYDRGTHTTTQGEYFKIKVLTSKGEEHSINIIDTPGVRHFAIYGIEAEDTALYFPEMEKLIGSCKFGLSCTHSHESGCAILEALKKGDIHKDRYTSFGLIYKELQETVRKY
ncbi:ribosome small subunit-dependent GTPase A [Treponema putidum]|uniref:Small ribosomal subunit biogenesis GTPase RsgA n=1 Tax=Treponema putidum TaxID=221027 RepID=A0ABY5HTL2_9SPIR|nr:ribosome small subunit-dependent GTPase A [Treponema putidum]UTY28767.1 ribosome small subunit-dependent GTPase A [Treponema putidum]